MGTQKRKLEHIKICLSENVEFEEKTTLLEKVMLEYRCLPEIDLSDVCLETEFLGKEFKAPVMVSAITGGIEEAKKINKDIAKACEALGIGFGLGSQRAMLENPELSETYYVRDVAPNIFVAGNIGASQLKEYSIEQIEEALQAVQADALAVHLNAAQEAVQPEGTPSFRGAIKNIARIAKKLSKPVYVKEVGHGISYAVAKELAKTGIKAIDVQGAGGTSWVKIEALRGKKHGFTFAEIGIPTAISIVECRKAFKGPIIASGGIRNGLQAVKAFVLGADLVALALPVLKAWNEGGTKAVEELLHNFIEELRIGLFLIGAKNVKEAKGRGRFLK